MGNCWALPVAGRGVGMLDLGGTTQGCSGSCLEPDLCLRVVKQRDFSSQHPNRSERRALLSTSSPQLVLGPSPALGEAPSSPPSLAPHRRELYNAPSMSPTWSWGPPSSPKHEQPPWVQGASAPTHPLTPSRVLRGWQGGQGGCLSTLPPPKSHAAGSQILLLAEGGASRAHPVPPRAGRWWWGEHGEPRAGGAPRQLRRARG